MSKRTVLAIATLALFTSFVSPSFAAEPAKPKHSAQKTACAEHIKKMKEMKTAAERDTYCKGDSACSANHCDQLMAHHGKAKHKASTTPAAPKAN